MKKLLNYHVKTFAFHALFVNLHALIIIETNKNIIKNKNIDITISYTPTKNKNKT